MQYTVLLKSDYLKYPVNVLHINLSQLTSLIASEQTGLAQQDYDLAHPDLQSVFTVIAVVTTCCQKQGRETKGKDNFGEI